MLWFMSVSHCNNAMATATRRPDQINASSIQETPNPEAQFAIVPSIVFKFDIIVLKDQQSIGEVQTPLG